MRILKPVLALFSLALILSACKEDLKINGNAKASAVVYAVLDPSETTHFIKVNRAFVTADNQIETAAIADSNYFASVQGTVKEYYNGELKRTFNLVDTVVENKASGVFYYPQQKVYMFKTTEDQPLKNAQGYVYKLELDINNGEFIVNGETELVRDVKITYPSNNPISKYEFANSQTSAEKYKAPKVAGEYGTGSMYDVRLRVSFAEFTSASDSTIKSFDWVIKTGDINGGTSKIISTQADGKTFYELIKNNASTNPNVIKRNLLEIEAVITSGSNVLLDYITLSKPSSTIAQSKITYTNLTATNNRNVLGIFTARTTVSLSKKENLVVNGAQLSAIDKNSMRELCKGPITGLLLFCAPSSVYQAEDYYCN